MSFENAIQQLAMDRLFEHCARLWGSVVVVGVILAYPPVAGSSADELASLEQQLECEMLCRKFLRRFKKRTAAYGAIRTVFREGHTDEGYGFLFILKPPDGIEPAILEKIIKECWDHCSDRITSIDIEEGDGRFAASVEFEPNPIP